LHFFVASLVRDFEMIRSPVFFAAIVSPVSSVFPSITVDAPKPLDKIAR
jgi:hypothetical protein